MARKLRSSIITKEDLLREVKLPLVDRSGWDAATILGIGQTTAYEMAKRGTLPAFKLGRRWWVTTATLRRMLGIEAA